MIGHSKFAAWHQAALHFLKAKDAYAVPQGLTDQHVPEAECAEPPLTVASLINIHCAEVKSAFAHTEHICTSRRPSSELSLQSGCSGLCKVFVPQKKNVHISSVFLSKSYLRRSEQTEINAGS